jgi:hypothetical protein
VHAIEVHLMGGHLMGGHLIGGHLMSGHLMGGHLIGVHLMSGHLMGGHLIGVHLIGGHLWAGILEARILWAWASRAEIATLILPPGPHPGIPLCWVAYGGVLWWPRMVPFVRHPHLKLGYAASPEENYLGTYA